MNKCQSIRSALQVRPRLHNTPNGKRQLYERGRGRGGKINNNAKYEADVLQFVVLIIRSGCFFVVNTFIISLG